MFFDTYGFEVDEVSAKSGSNIDFVMKKVAEKLILRHNKRNEGKQLSNDNKVLKLGGKNDKNSKFKYFKGKIDDYGNKCQNCL